MVIRRQGSVAMLLGLSALLVMGQGLSAVAGRADSRSGGHHGAASHAVPESGLPRLAIDNGNISVSLRVGAGVSKADLIHRQPCLRLTFAGGTDVRACLAGPHRVRVTPSDGPVFRIPYSLVRHGRRLALDMRQADLMLPTGSVTARVSCRSGCSTRTIDASIPLLRFSTCTAHGPWLTHGAPRRIGKAIAMTFDDGPAPATKTVLRILAAENVPATFFEVGRNIQQRPGLARRVVARGNMLGNHSYSHPVMNAGDLKEITRTQRIIRHSTDFDPCIFRAPYGENPPDVVALARSQGLDTIHWNVDPGDWRGLDTQAIVSTSLSESRPGSIAVFHDGEGRPEMLAALPKFIDAMRARGYRFLTIPELLGLDIVYRGS